jgi:spore coat-associated protein N
MQRAAVLWRASPGRLVAALFALMLAAAMAVGSGANFNSTSSNVGNVVTAGIIDHDNNGSSLNITKLMPGTPQSGDIELVSTGDDAAHSYLRASNLVDTPGPGGGNLSPDLDLEIRDTLTGTVVFDDKLDQLATVDLGAWDAGVTRNYRFTVELPDTGTGGSDNEFMASSVSLDLDWELTS